MADVAQQLRFLDGLFQIELHPTGQGLPQDDAWLAVVRAPDGVTVITRAKGEGDHWIALYSGDTAHDLDVPGMLSSLLLPLKSAGIPVFVASTHTADVVLVPSARRTKVIEALESAGHLVT
ncbi:ACT domain-containing protein [Kribbella sp. NPDC051718]|uniref:ACT domain-containing protein n=1 Tax=Kribbella sp. NPDC051718 TaxID=3155168 RepID=UPI00342F32DD